MGFGKVAGKLTIPLEKWIGWWKAKELSAKEFRKDLSLIISKSDLSDATNNDLENHNFEATIKKYNDSENTNAGLRAIIRELLKTLREAAPDNGLLIKENRDRIFNDYCRAEEKKLNDNS